MPITGSSGHRSRPTTLGTSADTRDGVNTDFDFVRLHHTAFYQLRPSLFVGAGLYFDNHFDVGPRTTTRMSGPARRTWNTASPTGCRWMLRPRPGPAST